MLGLGVRFSPVPLLWAEARRVSPTWRVVEGHKPALRLRGDVLKKLQGQGSRHNFLGQRGNGDLRKISPDSYWE